MSLRPALVSALMLLTLGGCDSRAGTEYQGEPLMTISGSVVVENDSAPAELLPALAFLQDLDSSQPVLRLHDVSVTGEFPASFTLEVFEPPPAEAMMELGDADGLAWPRAAIGFITAASPEHPATVDIPSQRLEQSCTVEPETDEVVQYQTCVGTSRLCVNEGQSCYEETELCDVRIENGVWSEECETVETTGDPGLERGVWRHFAGVSSNFMVIYLPEGARAGTAPAHRLNGGQDLGPGYHLVEQTPFSPAELEVNEACAAQAEGDAYVEYNRAHGTGYTSFTDVPDETFDETMDEIHALEARFRHERRCRPGSHRHDLVPSHAARDLTITIGPDFATPLLF